MLSRSKASLLTISALFLLNVLVFAQTLSHPFVAYDDGQYVFENNQVRAGLTGPSVAWAWTSTTLGYYPLTWMSHMSDVQLYGLNAGGHHASALVLHILSTFVLFFALRSLTGDWMRSAVVAALFAIHPMRVESVAWISERKDTLSTLFGLLALAAYPKFARERSLRHGVLIALALAASLLSKQMLMTLPFVFLLLDYWPLGRRDWSRAIVEKLPFFALTIAAVTIAFAGQHQLNAVQSTEAVPMATRIGTAMVAYTAYLGKLFWPAKMAAYYPYSPPGSGAVAVAALVVLAITAAAIALRRKAPYLLVGWLWFLGTLVPVIGIIQIGSQFMADRYTYFPFIGLFIAIVWGAADLVRDRRAAAAVALTLILILTPLAFRQTRYWRSNEALFEHALAVTGPNPSMEYSLSQSVALTDPDKSLVHSRRGLEILDPKISSSTQRAQFYVTIGNALVVKAQREAQNASAGDWLTEADTSYRRAIEIDPEGTGNARRNLQLIQQMTSPPPRPPPPIGSAAAKDAQMSELFDRGLNFLNARDLAHAIATFQQAVDLEPAAVDARMYLGIALVQARRNAEAVTHFEAARKFDAARANEYITKALRMQPDPRNLDTLIEQLKAN